MYVYIDIVSYIQGALDETQKNNCPPKAVGDSNANREVSRRAPFVWYLRRYILRTQMLASWIPTCWRPVASVSDADHPMLPTHDSTMMSHVENRGP